MSTFEYIDRKTCICGAGLDGKEQEVSKDHPWGVVSFRQCTSCRSWIQTPQISVSSLKKWYDSDSYQSASTVENSQGIYLNYEASEPQRLIEAEARFKRDQFIFGKCEGNILEVGCATGSFIKVLQGYGWVVEGIDLSPRFAEMGKRINNLDIRVGDFLDEDFSGKKFDVIVMLGTVSNIQDFCVHAKHIFALLKPGGVFCFNFPSSASLVSRLYGKKYWMFTPSVSTFFTETGLDYSLKEVGFSDIKFKNDWQRPSLSKVLGQAGFGKLYKYMSHFSWINKGLPFSLPIPGVVVGYAKKSNTFL